MYWLWCITHPLEHNDECNREDNREIRSGIGWLILLIPSGSSSGTVIRDRCPLRGPLCSYRSCIDGAICLLSGRRKANYIGGEVTPEGGVECNDACACMFRSHCWQSPAYRVLRSMLTRYIKHVHCACESKHPIKGAVFTSRMKG